jgi:transposase
MGKTTRKRYSGEFKAKVALEAIRGDLTLSQLGAKYGVHQTLSQLGAKYGVHQTLINTWKKQAVENLSTVFESKADAGQAREADIEKLHAKIGQLIVERDFLAKAFGR